MSGNIVDAIVEAQLDIIEGASEQELREIMAANGDDYDAVGARMKSRIDELLAKHTPSADGCA